MMWASGAWLCTDNSAALSAPAMALVYGGTQHIVLAKDASGAAWTASGTKGANGTVIFEI